MRQKIDDVVLLSEHVCDTIANMSTKPLAQSRRQKEKNNTNSTYKFTGLYGCVNSVNDRNILASYVFPVHATWLKIIYLASSKNGEYADINNVPKILFLRKT